MKIDILLPLTEIVIATVLLCGITVAARRARLMPLPQAAFVVLCCIGPAIYLILWLIFSMVAIQMLLTDPSFGVLWPWE